MSDIIKSSQDFSNKRTFLPAELYLPEWARNTEFFNDISILLNYVEDSLKDFSNPKYAKVAEFYRDIFFKYKNVDLLSEDALKAFIRENGYGLIIDMLELDIEKLRLLAIYMPLFKMLKATDEGYRQLLKLIAYDFVIETWLDNPQELDEYTYNITLITFLNTGFDASIVKNFIKLSRFYVYPVLKNIVIKVIYRDNQPFVHGLPSISKSIKVRNFQEIMFTFTIVPTPADSTVTLTSVGGTQEGNSISVIAGSTVNWKVEHQGYFTKSGTYLVDRGDVTLNVELESGIYLTINPVPMDATVLFEIVGPAVDGGSAINVPNVAIDGGSATNVPVDIIDQLNASEFERQGNTIMTRYGVDVRWTVFKDTYETVTGIQHMIEDTVLTVELGRHMGLTINPTPLDATVTFMITGPIIDGGSTSNIPTDIIDGHNASDVSENIIEDAHRMTSQRVNNTLYVSAPADITWTVSKEGYTTRTGTTYVTEYTEIDVDL